MPLSTPYIDQINYIDNYNKKYKNSNIRYNVIEKRSNYIIKNTKLNINNSKSVRNISNYNYIF